MLTYAYPKRDDGSFIFGNPEIVDDKNVPEGFYIPEVDKHYNSDGYEMEPPEPQPQEPTVEERLQALESIELERILGGVY